MTRPKTLPALQFRVFSCPPRRSLGEGGCLVGNRYKQNYKLTGEHNTMNTLIRTSIERPADLRQLIRKHQFVTETTPINKHQQNMKQSMKIKTIPCQHRRSPACIASRTAGRTLSLLVLFALGAFAVSPPPNAFGVSPPPDGGYPGGNTAEGQAALFGLTSGTYNTAVGFLSLRTSTEGSANSGIEAAFCAGPERQKPDCSVVRAAGETEKGGLPFCRVASRIASVWWRTDPESIRGW